MTRGDLADRLEQFRIKVTSTVTKDCYTLITGGDTTSSKYKKAKQQGIPIIDYWRNMGNVLTGNF